MATLYTPTEKGFNTKLQAIDQCQIGLLRELVGHEGSRLILKGGMAMRAVFGSMRLTKDIDFDRDPSLSQDVLKKGLTKNLLRAAVGAGIKQSTAQVTKDTKTTVRMRLQGHLADGQDVRFDVEVSGRGTQSQSSLRRAMVAPPPCYGMAPFAVMTYTNEALAVMKIAAALSQQRYAPRDLYDLRDMVHAGVDPIDLLVFQDADLLRDFSARALDKVEMLSYSLAQQELLPYLPPSERDALTEDAWMEAALLVADRITGWCQSALDRQSRNESEDDDDDGLACEAKPERPAP